MVSKDLLTLIIKTDGGARGNPGPAAAGVYITDQFRQNPLASFGQYLGSTTNNVAEYKAVIAALEWVATNKTIIDHYSQIRLISDSTLLVNQLSGRFKIKKPHLLTLVYQVKKLEQSISIPIYYQHVKREHNYEPDLLVNSILNKINTG